MAGQRDWCVVVLNVYGDRYGERMGSVWPTRQDAVDYLTREWRLLRVNDDLYHGTFEDGSSDIIAHVLDHVPESPLARKTFAERLGDTRKRLPLPEPDDRVAMACNAVFDQFGSGCVLSGDVWSGSRAAYVGFAVTDVDGAYADGCIVYDDACVQWVLGDAASTLDELGLDGMRPCGMPPLTERLAGIVYRMSFADATAKWDIGFMHDDDGSITVMDGGRPSMAVMQDFSTREL